MKLLVINDLGIEGGGTENRISTLIGYFLKNHVVEEVHILQKKMKKEECPKHDKIKIHYSPKGYIAAYFFTKNLIKRQNIDFVQAHNMVLLKPSVILAAKRLRKPVVWYAHDYWAICTLRNFIDPHNAMRETLCRKAYGERCNECRKNIKTSLRFFLWKKILNRIDLGIGAGEKVVEIHEKEGILRGKWRIVTPWIDPIMFNRENPKNSKRNKDIVFVGSLIDFKGAWVAVKSLKRILKKVPDANLIFIGSEQERDSVYRKKIESIAKKDNVAGNIKFLGKKDRKAIKEKLIQAGAYVCPTVCMESFGLNWAEAMALGSPVIASCIGTIPEYINMKNKNGILFNPRDEEELAKAIIRVLKDRRLSNELSENGRYYASEHFNLEKRGKEIRGIYKGLLAKKRAELKINKTFFKKTFK